MSAPSLPRLARRGLRAARLLPWRIKTAGQAWERSCFSNAALVTFDVFDTALFRSVALPACVFWLAAYRAGAHDVEAVARARIAAEDRAREAARAAGRFEVTLDEIFAHIDPTTLGGAALATLKAQELATEQAVCAANPAMLAVFDALVARGTRVAFISDTYLDATFIETLLRQAGYAGTLRVHASSTNGLSKADGNLFPAVAAMEATDPAHICHVGDNAAADVLRARQAGWNALWYRPHLSQPRPTSVGHGERRIVASLMAGIPTSLRTPGESPVWPGIGHAVAGPIFVGFTQFLAAALLRDRIDRVAFCARDGLIIRAVYEKLRASVPGLPPSLYLLVSRRSLVFPAIEQLGEAELDFLTGQFAALRVEEFLARIGLDASAHQPAIAARGLAAATRVASAHDIASLRLLLLDLAPAIVEAAARERALLLAYLEQEGILAPSQLAMVDVGWHGSLQKALGKLLAREGREVPLHGYYFGTSPAIRAMGLQAGTSTGWFVDAGEPEERFEITRTQWAVLELLFTAEHGSVLGYRATAGGLEAVLDEQQGGEAPPEYEHAAGAIQAAALLFADRYLKAFGTASPLAIEPADVAAPLERLALFPTSGEASAIGDLFHVDGFGATRTGQFIARPPRHGWRRSPQALIRAYRAAAWRRGFLVRLFGGPKAALAVVTMLAHVRPGFKSK